MQWNISQKYRDYSGTPQRWVGYSKALEKGKKRGEVFKSSTLLAFFALKIFFQKSRTHKINVEYIKYEYI